MRTNIEIDDELMQQAMAISKQTTKKAVVEDALRLMVQLKLQGEAIERLRGTTTWVGPDDDWFVPDPLDPEWNKELAKRVGSASHGPGDRPDADVPRDIETTSVHDHR